MTPHADVLPDGVEEMLLDAGFEQDHTLRAALLSLGSLASLPAPVPSGRLAALLDEDGGGPAWDQLGQRRKLRAHRSTVMGLALMAGMGMGVGGVAASLPPGHSGSPSVQLMLQDGTPAWSVPAPPAPGSVLQEASGPVSSADAVKPEAPKPGAGETAASQPNRGGAAEEPAGPGSGPATVEKPAPPPMA